MGIPDIFRRDPVPTPALFTDEDVIEADPEVSAGVLGGGDANPVHEAPVAAVVRFRLTGVSGGGIVSIIFARVADAGWLSMAVTSTAVVLSALSGSEAGDTDKDR